MHANAFSVQSLADRWAVHPNTLRRQLRKGQVPAPLKIGGQYRWPVDVIEAFEKKQLAGGFDATK